MFELENGRKHFFQWDTGQRLIINDNTVIEAHFCNRTDDCSLICEAYTDGGKRVVDVPNILLQDDWDIRVYAYCGNYTKIEERFEVVKRTRPADYVYTETQVKSWDVMEERVNNTLTSIERLGEELSSAESMRQVAEDERVIAENERVMAEEARADEYNDSMNAWGTSVYTAVNSAKSATAKAETATENANNAITALLAYAIVCDKTGMVVNINDAMSTPIKVGETYFSNVSDFTIHVIGKNFIPYANTDVEEIEYSNSTGTKTKVKGYIVSLPPGKYVASGEYKPNYSSGVHIYCMKIDKDNKILQSSQRIIAGANKLQAEIEIESGERLLIYNGSSASQNLSYSKTQFGKVNLMVSTADVDTTFEEYSGASYDIHIPATIANGVYDWGSGNIKDLDTGTVYTTDAHPITLKYQYNNLWSNGGETHIQYIADTKLYIDNKFNDLQNAIVSLGSNV